MPEPTREPIREQAAPEPIREQAAPEPAREQAAPEPAPEPALEQAPEPVEPVAGARPAGRRWWGRAASRWTAALVVFGLFGGAAAYAVTRPERTRIPGLRTPGDGRWPYPAIAPPVPPAGRPRPLDEANAGGVHYADLRSLLLPRPRGATADRTLPGGRGWLAVGGFTGRFDTRDGVPAGPQLVEDGLRHVAATGWTTPDGVRTGVYLAQFLSAGYAGKARTEIESMWPKGVTDEVGDGSVRSAEVPSRISVVAFTQGGPSRRGFTRFAYVLAGDTVAVVVQSRAAGSGDGGAAAEVPFRQTVRLQARLLG